MVVVAILSVLGGIAVLSLREMSERLLLRSAVSDIVFYLEEAKARSVAGSGGEAHGIYFDENEYVAFAGTEYDEEDSGNVTHELDNRLEIDTDILGDEQAVIFTRITGTVGESVEIRVQLQSDAESYRVVTVGPGGDIAYGD